MKNKFLIILLATLFFSFPLTINPHEVRAAAGDLCCNRKDANFRDFVSFDPATQTCLYRDAAGTTGTEIFRCAYGVLDPTFTCEQQNVGLNRDYICVLANNPPDPTLPDAGGATVCCNYTSGVQFDPSSQQCVRYVGSGPTRTAISSAPNNCQADSVCVARGLISDGRPFHICQTSSNATIECPDAGFGSRCINTALGPIHTDAAGFTKQILGLGIGVGSGIAFLMILYGSFKLVTSQGNPEGIAQGKEIITSAIVGLVFIVLSVTILQVIGVDILGITAYGF